MGSKIWLIAVVLVAVSVGLEALPVGRDDYPIDFGSDGLLDGLAEGDGLYEDNYEMDYPYVEDGDPAAANDDDDDVNGNELEDSRGALDEMGLEDPRWRQSLRLSRLRDRRPRSIRTKGKKNKAGSRKPRKGKKKKAVPTKRPKGKKKKAVPTKRPKGKKKKAGSKKQPTGKPPAKRGGRKSSGRKGGKTTQKPGWRAWVPG